jgi:signal transduction histidine kinase
VTRTRRRLWTYVRGLLPPVLLWALFVGVLIDTLRSRLGGGEEYDKAALREWVQEARVFRETLPGLIQDYLHSDGPNEQLLHAEKIREQLKALGDVTKMNQNVLPLFPAIYRLEITFDPGQPYPLLWDSNVPRPRGQVQRLSVLLYDQPGRTATLHLDYLLHAFNKRQRDELAANNRLRWVTLLAVAGSLLALVWVWLVQRRERERQRQRQLAQQQLDQAEHLRLEEELRRRDAEQRREEAERKLLEQRLATQAAERQALELKSQLYASIGIMAGSYAHNIKNLLVRPNDLLRRCLEADGLSADQEFMLREVRQTLGTVTERLQQILRTVRRDPSRPERTRLDLNELVRELQRTWEDLAREKWKVTLRTETSAGLLWIDGDPSHLQQAVENLLFNARDATFEMRGHLREQARRQDGLTPEERREALIAAAAWKGAVVLRTERAGDRAVLEVRDNGIGMTDEVRRRCTETHFSTKRDNALHAGNSVGMGLGLSFVAVILEHHGAALAIESAPLQGATFRVSFPASGDVYVSRPEGAAEGVSSGREP